VVACYNYIVKNKIFVVAVSIVTLAIGAWYISIPFVGPNRYVPDVTPTPAQAPQLLKLTSSAFANEDTIPALYTCDGQKIHPPLSISGVPNGTKSLAIIIDDPDAPAGTFTHWAIWNIDPGTVEIPAGSVPSRAMEGTNSLGSRGFTSPCPPKGAAPHRYFFTLYALDNANTLDGKATKDDLVTAMNGHIIEQTNLIGSYGR
jgi:Raf kinase inhibitor-like YbhB/YbcL family protein